jgi:hypothetical protein
VRSEKRWVRSVMSRLVDPRKSCRKELLHLSTGHIQESDSPILHNCPGLDTTETKYGWFIEVLYNCKLVDVVERGASESLISLIEYALQNDVAYIYLQGSAPIHPKLPHKLW